MKVLTIELDLGDIVNENERSYSGEDGPAPVTLLDAIVNAASAQLVARIPDEARVALRERVRAITDQEIRERVKPLIEEALIEPVQPVFGGPRMPLAEHIVAVVKKELARPGDRFDSRNASSLAKIIHDEVQRVLRGELQEALSEAKQQVLDAVKQQGADVLTETIERMSRGR